MANYTITGEQAQEARRLFKKEKDTKIALRLLVIALRGEGKTYKEIAETTGFALTYLPTLFKKFSTGGFEAIQSDKRTGNNRKVTFPQEKEFLAKYSEKADKGEILTVEEIRLDFEEEFQVSIGKRAFYNLLKRHNWRKIMPRRRHPKKASAEEIECSKKLTPKSTSK